LILIDANFAVENVQLFVGKLQLTALPQLFKPTALLALSTPLPTMIVLLYSLIFGQSRVLFTLRSFSKNLVATTTRHILVHLWPTLKCYQTRPGFNILQLYSPQGSKNTKKTQQWKTTTVKETKY